MWNTDSTMNRRKQLGGNGDYIGGGGSREPKIVKSVLLEKKRLCLCNRMLKIQNFFLKGQLEIRNMMAEMKKLCESAGSRS